MTFRSSMVPAKFVRPGDIVIAPSGESQVVHVAKTRQGPDSHVELELLDLRDETERAWHCISTNFLDNDDEVELAWP